jgi:hypothetical protein
MRGILRRLPEPVRNGATLVGSVVFALLWIGTGLRVVHLSNDPRVLVYPRVASDINGFKDDDFEREIPEGQFRMLALGASAFVTRDFQPRFQERMNGAGFFRDRGLSARVVSAGVPAHTSFDALWKYRWWYGGYDFDLVIVYEAINDARANNYPRDVFRADYAQFPYYRRFAPVFDWIEGHPLLSRSFAATFGVSLFQRARVQLAPAFQREAPYNSPLDDPWLAEGADLKTPPVFERNIEEILRIARERGQRVLLLTYAYYLPDDYTNERFLSHETDYSFAPESVATEVWGRKENVVAAIEAHNAAIRRIAERHPEAIFFDMERAMPKDGRHFIDICHWTDLGREVFARGVLEALARHESEVLGNALARRWGDSPSPAPARPTPPLGAPQASRDHGTSAGDGRAESRGRAPLRPTRLARERAGSGSHLPA